MQKLKPLYVETESYLGNGLVFVIIEFTEKRNRIPLREVSICLLEKYLCTFAPLQLSHPELNGEAVCTCIVWPGQRWERKTA